MTTPHRIRSSLLAVTLGSAALLASTLAPAAEPSAKDKTAMEAVFTRVDLNGDGKLSREEAERLPAIAAMFDKLDADHDGQLTLAEFAVGYHSAP
jgi:Ca2+-binding EF-hand superfamily protein